MPRFVILRHDPPTAGERTLHWDLMLESGDSLLTWALEHEPAGNQHVAARQLANHRCTYLDYEGPVSGGRGVVSRWDAGTFSWLQQHNDELIITVLGRILQGQIRLRRTAEDDQRWVISFASAEGSNETR